MLHDQQRAVLQPDDNQAMGWSIPAALGAQKCSDRQTLTITGDAAS